MRNKHLSYCQADRLERADDSTRTDALHTFFCNFQMKRSSRRPNAQFTQNAIQHGSHRTKNTEQIIIITIAETQSGQRKIVVSTISLLMEVHLKCSLYKCER